MQKAKAIEVGNIFPLKDKFSKAFKLTFKDEKGKEHLVQMGCYGIGLGRLMGTIVEVHHDERGIIWPREVAPFLAHVISLPGGEKAAENAYEELQDAGIEVLFDDRQESPGVKLADADLLGMPFRVVSSEKTTSEDCFEVKKRDKGKAELLRKTDVASFLTKRT